MKYCKIASNLLITSERFDSTFYFLNNFKYNGNGDIFSKEYILVTTLSNLLPLTHGRVTDSQPIHPSQLLMNPVYPSIPSQMYPSQSESILTL